MCVKYIMHHVTIYFGCLNDCIARPVPAGYTGGLRQGLRWKVTAQEEFDSKYVSSTELCRDLGVTRATLVNGRRRLALPEPVRIYRPNGDVHIMIWLRAEAAPYVERWKAELAQGRAL
jgi:hypothetical protein